MPGVVDVVAKAPGVSARRGRGPIAFASNSVAAPAAPASANIAPRLPRIPNVRPRVVRIRLPAGSQVCREAIRMRPEPGTNGPPYGRLYGGIDESLLDVVAQGTRELGGVLLDPL